MLPIGFLVLLMSALPTARAAAATPGRDLASAPPAFLHEGVRHVPVDFLDAELTIDLDAAQRTAKGRALIRFYAAEAGRPLLDLVPDTVSRVTLNGTEVAGGLGHVSDPAGVTQLRAVPAVVAARSTNTLEISYELDPASLTYEAGGARLGFFMTDLKPRGYLERYAPANLLFDRHPTKLTLNLAGAPGTHRLYANGATEKRARDSWVVRFPPYFTASSYYLHLTNKSLHTLEGRFRGANAAIPFTIYAEDRLLAERALPVMYRTLAELEADYGHYAHEEMLVYMTPSGGGMEYAGAAMTSLTALSHEIFHMWFARSVMPADGNAGWIDEALASWRDEGYPRPPTRRIRKPSQLSGFPAFRRETPGEAYTDGMELAADIDFATASAGGLKGLIGKLFKTRPRTVMTTAEFRAFLEGAGGIDLRSHFDRYVFGRDVPENESRFPDLPLRTSTHPREYTDAELEAYR